MEIGLANPKLYALLNTRGRSEPSPATAAGIDVLRTHVRRLTALASCASTSSVP
ncbi:MAG: hypothetical protein M3Q87_08155 [Actinomycetota bacterium]|nr:hypothetical protein [Actinomycetota bacterium]